MTIQVKRIYAPPDEHDGLRVLVDRLWPRGIKKADAHVDRWLKELAPSAELRTWFDHDPAKWDEFQRRYEAELLAHATALSGLMEQARERVVTLLFAARDEQHNNAVVLKAYLEHALES